MIIKLMPFQEYGQAVIYLHYYFHEEQRLLHF
jgi:hypothetical protein